MKKLKKFIRRVTCQHRKPLKSFVENQRTPKKTEEWILICGDCDKVIRKMKMEKIFPGRQYRPIIEEAFNRED